MTAGSESSVCLLIDDFLPLPELTQLLAYTIDREVDFADATILRNGSNLASVDLGVRRIGLLPGADSVPPFVLRRLRQAVPELARRLGHEVDESDSLEAHLTATGDGGFFLAHSDSSHPAVQTRSTTFVFFFSQNPRPFEGGELCVERDWRSGDRIYLQDNRHPDGLLQRREVVDVIEPQVNRLVAFSSYRMHEVRPVRVQSRAFASSRFTVTGALHRNRMG
jgi:hypothetical protein